MTVDIKTKQKLTFSQAEGLEELPGPLALEEVPHSFRVRVWSLIYLGMGKPTFGDRLVEPWKTIASSLWMMHFDRALDDFSPYWENVGREYKAIIMHGRFHEVFNLLTALLRHPQCPPDLRKVVAKLLENNRMAYYLDLSGAPTFISQSSPEEGVALRASISALAKSGMDGACTHLRDAAELMNQGKFADSARASISAVECVARVISGEADKTLTPALKELEKRGLLTHKALASGFEKLYGYTSNEKGIRHSLLEKGEANVDVEEATFMLGACASFCAYLCRKQAKMAVASDGG